MKYSQLISAAIVAVIVLLLAGALSLWSAKQAAQNAARQAHTLDVIVRAESLRADIIHAETTQRGYLLTADESYLKPDMDAMPAIATEMADLRRFTADHPAQQQRLKVIQSLIDARLSMIEETIVLQRLGNATAAADMVRSGKGKALMDTLRQLVL